MPDRGWHRSEPRTTYVATAALAVEVLSPHDETWDKLEFYAGHGVDEILIVSPAEHSVTWLELREGRYVAADHSDLLSTESRGLADRITWPAA